MEIAVAVGSEERILHVTAATVATGRGPGGRVLVCTDVSSQRELERRKAEALAARNSPGEPA